MGFGVWGEMSNVAEGWYVKAHYVFFLELEASSVQLYLDVKGEVTI